MAKEYIDRKALKEALYEERDEEYKRNTAPCIVIGLNHADDIIDSIPAADVVEVVRGKWEDVHIDRPEIADIEVASMFCPNCNRWHNEVYHYGNPIEFVNFCSFCGADMRDGDGE